ncbi:phosphate/phosphite/phosphonate ABC transporter substrate-binding protein [Paenibacillus psychroresistens]|uniref:Phosphate/phosphite/phosphonate ABC transporter substrate-binding protein n=1 Tax=Paenibacillus psychroresistens TaxID=1778678 RepID=A0A6B8RV74_9BACL|nr:phosphate/phosphite/phosphonate ABC transporter substrate-binding protein [Paenibacillus psychroresistens]QGQ99664.1 phosphate/phosphite/phosphonate ABC transporter substrate-binding protein [Paenibacillus psychroresistens]
MRKLLVLAAIICLLIGIAACISTPKKLTIGFVPSGSPEKMKVDFQPIQLYLEKTLGVKVDVFIPEDYLGLIEAMKNKKVDIGWYGAFSYIAAESQMKLDPMVIQSRYGYGTIYHSLIVTRSDSEIHTVEDLQGKSFAFVDKGSTSGFVVPMALFKSRDLDYEQYLGDTIFSGSHDAVFNDVMSKKANAGAMDDLTLGKKIDTGEIKVDDIRIIWKSNDIPGSPFVARADLNSKLKNRFKTAMIQLNQKAPAAIKAFDSKTEKYIPFEPSMYNEIRNIATLLGNDYIRTNFLQKK